MKLQRISEQVKPILADCGVWLRWVLATTTGFGLGSVVLFFLAITVYFEGYLIVFGLMLFVCVGVMQWGVLRLTHRLRGFGWWIPLTMAGWCLGIYIGYTIGDRLGTDLSNAIMFMLHDPNFCSPRRALVPFRLALDLGDIAKMGCKGIFFGVSVGFAQYWVLRRSVRRAGWWILTTTLSTTGSLLLADIISRDWDEELGIFFVIPLLGILIGATTGIPLVWLLKHPLPPTIPDQALSRCFPMDGG